MLTLSEYAQRRNLSRQRIHALIQEGRIWGAEFNHGRWLIPAKAKIQPPQKLICR